MFTKFGRGRLNSGGDRGARFSVEITGGLGVQPLVHVFTPPILSSMLTLGAADPLVLSVNSHTG